MAPVEPYEYDRMVEKQRMDQEVLRYIVNPDDKDHNHVLQSCLSCESCSDWSWVDTLKAWRYSVIFERLVPCLIILGSLFLILFYGAKIFVEYEGDESDKKPQKETSVTSSISKRSKKSVGSEDKKSNDKSTKTTSQKKPPKKWWNKDKRKSASSDKKSQKFNC